MKKLGLCLFGIMTVITVSYCTWHAAKESKPWFIRMRDKVRGTRIYSGMSKAVNRVTDSNIVQSSKTKVVNAGGRVTHLFKRREHSDNSQVA